VISRDDPTGRSQDAHAETETAAAAVLATVRRVPPLLVCP
jgi:hypothetical protein